MRDARIVIYTHENPKCPLFVRSDEKIWSKEEKRKEKFPWPFPERENKET